MLQQLLMSVERPKRKLVVETRGSEYGFKHGCSKILSVYIKWGADDSTQR